MDSDQLSIPISPGKQPGAVDDLYEAAWELLAETIRKNTKHKSTGELLGEYLPDTREDSRGASTPKALSFVFLSPASACDVQMAVTAHWFELAAALAASELAALCEENGFKLRAPKQTALDLAKAPRKRPFIPRGDAIVAVVRGKKPEIEVDNEGEVPLDEAELSPAAKKLARAANESGLCACPFCEKVRAKKAVAAKLKKAKPAKPTKPGELPKLEHFTSMTKALKSPDRAGSIEVPAKEMDPNEIPPDIGKLQRLTSLVVNGYSTRLPASVFELRELESLAVRVRGEPIPDAIGQLTKLKWVRMSGTSIPDTIGQLTALEALDLEYTRARAIPEALTTLPKLTRLELSNLMAIDQPLPNLGALTTLRSLTISTAEGQFGAETKRRLELKNVDFSRLKALVSLSLGSVTAFPAHLHDMPALEELKLARIDGAWPEVFDTLPALKNLKAEKVGLTAWPKTLNDLPKLRDIQFSGAAQLASLEGLRSLPALERLYIGGAPLARLPDAAPLLPALKALDLEYTKITHLPAWLSELPALEFLSLPRSSFPQEEIDALKAKRPNLRVSQ